MRELQKIIDNLEREGDYLRDIALNQFGRMDAPTPTEKEIFKKNRADIFAALHALDQAIFALKRAERVTKEEL